MLIYYKLLDNNLEILSTIKKKFISMMNGIQIHIHPMIYED
jgi:hypothetical protein